MKSIETALQGICLCKYNMKKTVLSLISLAVFVPKIASAHCPLCTAGAGALAVAAAYFGISSMIVGVFVGAFALALGLWLAKLPKKKYIPYQYLVLVIIIFLSTVIPIMPLVQDYAPLYVPFWGEFGKTFAVSLFLAGVPLGALVLSVSPVLSRRLSGLRGGKLIPYQGIAITIVLLILVSLIIQFL